MVTVEQERPVRLLSGRQAAEYLGLNRELVRRAIESGQIPSVVIGKRKRVSVVVLDRMLAEGTQVGVGSNG
jgi:excisionase family DNA binding protein